MRILRFPDVGFTTINTWRSPGSGGDVPSRCCLPPTEIACATDLAQSIHLLRVTDERLIWVLFLHHLPTASHGESVLVCRSRTRLPRQQSELGRGLEVVSSAQKRTSQDRTCAERLRLQPSEFAQSKALPRLWRGGPRFTRRFRLHQLRAAQPSLATPWHPKARTPFP